MNIRLRLIDKWRTSHTFWSVQLAVIIALLAGLQAEVLPALQAQLAPSTYAVINGLLAFVLVIARIIHQGPPPSGASDPS